MTNMETVREYSHNRDHHCHYKHDIDYWRGCPTTTECFSVTCKSREHLNFAA